MNDVTDAGAPAPVIPPPAKKRGGWMVPGGFIAAVGLAWWLGLVPSLGGETAYPSAAEQVVAPDFDRPTVDGVGRVRTADWRGKIVLVNVWATWCPPCRWEIPALASVYRTYRDQGLAVVGVSIDSDGPEKVNAFVQEHAVPYPVVMGDAGLIAAFGGVRAVPTSFLLDRQGRIVKKYVGLLPGPRLERDVNALLAQTPGQK
ncbi:MAG: TlpA family protein disulfide reductase [Candidatus Sericytochromatia bacterium]|nr:TlpA family protein disulfide reductase [Candidatus Sericytochromatia bacterium]